MNKIPPRDPSIDYSEPDGEFITITFEQLLAAAKRQLRLVLVCAALGLIGGLAYILVATPAYQSTARILIDNTRIASSDPSQALVRSTDMAQWVASQIELVGSRDVVARAVSRLDLDGADKALLPPAQGDNPLTAQVGNLMGKVTRLMGRGNGPTRPPVDPKTAQQEAAINAVMNGLQVIQQPGTYVIDVSFETPNPELSARVVNAVAQAYIDEQFSASQDASDRTTQWVADQVAALSRNATAAQAAVDAFQQQNGLVQADGKLLPDQQLAAANTDLSAAQAKLSQDRAQLAQGKALLEAGDPSGILGAVGDDPAFGQLRQQYSDAVSSEAAITAKFGPDHPQAAKLRGDISRVTDQLRAGYSTLVNGYQAQVSRDEDSIARLTERVASLSALVAKDSTSLQQLQALQRTAQTYRDLQQNFLTRLQQAQQQGTFPVSAARIIQEATPSYTPSSPKKLNALIFGIMGGLVLGAGIGFLRETADRSVRTGGAVTEEIGVGFLGYIPSMRERGPLNPQAKGRDMLRYVALYPHSLAAGTIRNTRVTIDLATGGAGQGRVVAVVSAREGEGKTTTAANLAVHLAKGGARVLLMDLDLVHPSLTKSFGLQTAPSVIDVLDRRIELERAYRHEEDTGVTVLGAGEGGESNADLLASPALQAVLARTRQEFDYVVLDTPPLGAVAETRVLLKVVDAAVCVIAWGATDIRAIQGALMPSLRSGIFFAGAVLTKGRIRDIKRYESGDWSPEQYGYLRPVGVHRSSRSRELA
jgi:succinoglycan biosynthesis transport protein ExoP